MRPTDHGRVGSTARVFRVPTSSGSSLVLEQGSRYVDLSHGLPPAKRGDLLELVERGVLAAPAALGLQHADRPTSAPTRVLTPLDPRHVGKVLALDRAPRAWFEAAGEQGARAWFSNRRPATLIASGAEIEPAELAGANEPETCFLQHEVFLAALIARRARGLDLRDAESAIAGYMVASDFTRRTLDGRPRTPWFGTSPSGALALGPAFVPRTCFDLDTLTVRARRVRSGALEPQVARTCAEFAHEVALAVAALSRLAILHPGDLVLVPTGIGLGRVEAGDEVRASIDGIGELATGVASRTLLRRQA